MLRSIILAFALCGAGSLTVSAADKPQKPPRTKEARQERKALLEKYDTDKDGKLSKEERAAVSAEDKEKLGKLRAKPAGSRKKKQAD